MKETPLYMEIFQALYDDIKSGKYTASDRLPSEMEIAEKYHVSRITSKKAFDMLAEKNLISRTPGKGSFVLSEDAETSPISEAGKTPSHPLIGFILSDYSESYGLQLVFGVEDEAAKQGCIIIPRHTHGQQDLEDESIDLLLELGVKGLIIMPVHGEHYNPKILRLILDGFPVVFIDRNLRGIPASFVGTDNATAARKAADYLLEAGHRHISFLSTPIQDTTAIEERADGFIKSHAVFGVPVDKSIWESSLTSSLPNYKTRENAEADVEKIKTLLRQKPEITCLFATEYNLALIAMEAVQETGLRVPEDISVLCFDGPNDLIRDNFITRVRQKEHDMGVIAVQLLMEQMFGKNECKKVFLDSDLLIGRSTRVLTPDAADSPQPSGR